MSVRDALPSAIVVTSPASDTPYVSASGRPVGVWGYSRSCRRTTSSPTVMRHRLRPLHRPEHHEVEPLAQTRRLEALQCSAVLDGHLRSILDGRHRYRDPDLLAVLGLQSKVAVGRAVEPLDHGAGNGGVRASDRGGTGRWGFRAGGEKDRQKDEVRGRTCYRSLARGVSPSKFPTSPKLDESANPHRAKCERTPNAVQGGEAHRPLSEGNRTLGWSPSSATRGPRRSAGT